MSKIHGIWGKPYIDLEPFLDLSALPAIHDEVCYSLVNVEPGYTGGSHRSMGIVPPSLAGEPWGDYGEVLKRLSREEFLTFLSLADDPSPEDSDASPDDFGEEKDRALSHRQMLWLKYRYRVYFPWKVFYELIPNRYWGEKAIAKSFTDEARALFPRTVAFVRSLPFTHVGRCLIMGLEANDFGTVHLDGLHAEKPEADHFITFCPNGDKRLFLWDEERREKLFIDRRAYWFNDSDYHGVEAAPFFRYSIRVDGVFRPEFVEKIRGGA